MANKCGDRITGTHHSCHDRSLKRRKTQQRHPAGHISSLLQNQTAMNSSASGHDSRPFSCVVRSIVAAAAWMMQALFTLSAQTTMIWNDTGADFSAGDSWIGGSAPAASLTANMAKFGAVSPAFQPSLTSSRGIGGIEFTNGAGAYPLSGAGTLTSGAWGIDNGSASGSQMLGLPLALGAATTFGNNTPTGGIFLNHGSLTLQTSDTLPATTNMIVNETTAGSTAVPAVPDDLTQSIGTLGLGGAGATSTSTNSATVGGGSELALGDTVTQEPTRRSHVRRNSRVKHKSPLRHRKRR